MYILIYFFQCHLLKMIISLSKCLIARTKLQLFCLLMACFFPVFVFAFVGSNSTKDAISIIEHLSTNTKSIQSLIVAFLYIAGICFFIKAIYYLKVYGEARTMMATTSSMKPPLTWLLVSVIFMAFPHALTVVMNSMFHHYNGILTYSEWGHAKADFDFELFVDAVFSIVRVIGLISFSRGWFIIAQSVQGGGHQASINKGLVHLFAGIIGMNIVRTLNVLDNSMNT